MLEPSLVADCVRAMRDAVEVPVTVKCRIGIDDQDSYEFFARFAAAVVAAGADALIVHARAAILGGLAGTGVSPPDLAPPELAPPDLAQHGLSAAGPVRRALSPKENREIPPLRYHYVHRLKAQYPDVPIVINGGLTDMAAVLAQAGCGLDGVMLGRAAYHTPLLLAELERAVIDPAWRVPEPREIVEQMVDYARAQATRGVRLHSITRHMHGLMAGRDGARAWRRFLSEVAGRADAVPETLLSSLPIVNQGKAA
jgi:tRNA-dihydrouridine synthase A